jgi:hypothetical protein
MVMQKLLKYLEDKVVTVKYPEPGWKKAYGINNLIMIVCKELGVAAQEALNRFPFFKGEEIMKAGHKFIKRILSQYFQTFESSIVEILENSVIPVLEKFNDESAFKSLFGNLQEYSENLLKPVSFIEAKELMARIAVNIVNLLLVKLVSTAEHKAKISDWERLISFTIQILKELFPELNVRLLQYYTEKEM